VYEAARRAAIHETISNFPDKYSTIVGERGLKVSILMLYLECMIELWGVSHPSFLSLS